MEFEETYPGEKDWLLAHAYCGVGAVEGRRGNPAAAFAFLKKALELAPDHAITLANIASCYADLGNLDAAIDALYRAVQMQPRADLAYNLAQLLCEAERQDLARVWFEYALKLGDSRAQEAIDSLPTQDTG
jgi:tetratricopeptide (TPR) repeat protein